MTWAMEDRVKKTNFNFFSYSGKKYPEVYGEEEKNQKLFSQVTIICCGNKKR
jgi:hypothetical protein